MRSRTFKRPQPGNHRDVYSAFQQMFRDRKHGFFLSTYLHKVPYLLKWLYEHCIVYDPTNGRLFVNL